MDYFPSKQTEKFPKNVILPWNLTKNNLFLGWNTTKN